MATKWWFQLILIPISTCFISGPLLNFGYGFFYKSGKHISYYIDGPNTYLEPTSNSTSTISLNMNPTNKLYGYKIHIWNSGNETINDINIRYMFRTDDSRSIDFVSTQETNPPFQSLLIKSIDSPPNSKIYSYEYINEQGEIIANFLANKKCAMNIIIHARGLKVHEYHSPKLQIEKNIYYKKICLIISIAIATLIFALARKYTIIKKMYYSIKKTAKKDLEFIIALPRTIKENNDQIDQLTETEKNILKEKTNKLVKKKTEFNKAHQSK